MNVRMCATWRGFSRRGVAALLPCWLMLAIGAAAFGEEVKKKPADKPPAAQPAPSPDKKDAPTEEGKPAKSKSRAPKKKKTTPPKPDPKAGDKTDPAAADPKAAEPAPDERSAIKPAPAKAKSTRAKRATEQPAATPPAADAAPAEQPAPKADKPAAKSRAKKPVEPKPATDQPKAPAAKAQPRRAEAPAGQPNAPKRAGTPAAPPASKRVGTPAALSGRPSAAPAARRQPLPLPPLLQPVPTTVVGSAAPDDEAGMLDPQAEGEEGLEGEGADGAVEGEGEAGDEAPAPKTPIIHRPAPPRTGLEVLKGLDPSLLNLSGAEILVQVVGDKVIVKGTEEDVARLQLLMTILDTAGGQKEVRVVTVSQQDANEIAQRIEQPIRDALSTPNQLEVDQPSITAMSSTVLLVQALPEQMDFILGVIEQVDATVDELGKIETMTFKVEHRKASEVASKLDEILIQMQDRRGVPAAKRIQVRPNSVNNTIMIVAPLSERETIAGLIAELDVEADPSWSEVRLAYFPLLHSEAQTMADTINDLLESLRVSQAAQEDTEEAIQRLLMSKVGPDGEVTDLPPISLEKKLTITPHDGTNSLIVATVQENIQPLSELIRLLDGVAMEQDMDVRIFAIRFADATKVVETLEDMFEKGKELPQEADDIDAPGVPSNDMGKALVYNIGLTADSRTNIIVATGRKEQLELVAGIVYELDQPASEVKFPLRLVALKHIDAAHAHSLIKSVMDKRMEALEALDAGSAAVERDRVFLSLDERTNSLIIAASEENYGEVMSIVAQIDVPSGKTTFDTIRIIKCGRLSATDLKDKIDELWQRKAAIRGELELPEDAPVVMADERSNALLIASSVQDFEEIQRLVDALQVNPLIEDTRLFTLKHADAVVLAAKLSEVFDGLSGSREGFKGPTIIPDSRTNTLIVAAGSEALERTEQLIARLDVPAGPQTANIEIYPLRHASVANLQPKMQELFDGRSEGQAGETTPIVLLPDEGSNSLIVSASADDQDVVVQLLGLLDKPSDLAKQFEIFPLKRARAAQIATKLGELFAAQGQGSEGRVDAIAAQPDERTNSIIVWASPSQMENIAQMVQKLDTTQSGVERMVRIIQLKQALAEDFATMLQETVVGENAGSDEEQALIVSFWQHFDDGSKELRKLLRQDIKITPDPRTNSLMVMAPAESMDMLEALIKDFDKIRPVNSELRLFPLINSDAEGMVDQLTNLFEPPAGAEGETRTQLNLGGEFEDMEAARVGQDLRFSADTRTNTIIAAGAEIDLRMIEELIRYLDSQDAEDRVVDVYQAKFRDSQEIATAVKSFNESEQSVLGDIADQTSQMRRMQRQVSIESLGSEENASGLILVGTSPQAYSRTMEMIQQLDRPEPQVAISVLIAEVTLTDDIELGVELAGQQLHFSEKAVLGPNGIIQGPGFDVVGGTSIGAAGSGQGFNFTVTGEDFGFLVHALQQDSRTEILSRPLLTVRNGEEGRISISDSIPFPATSQINDTGSTNTTISREDVGIILTAKPQISPDGYVTIEMTQEVSNFSGENLQITEGVSAPVISKREVETNVTVRDGDTVVIGGLITSRDSEGTTKIPILGDLPYVGPLFRTTSHSTNKTELLVILTVDVLNSADEYHRMSVEQRDKFVLPDRIRQSPLMEGLRIMPGESPLGPKDATPVRQGPNPAQVPPGGATPQFGPRPKIYGPTISQPTSATTASAPVFGPKMVRGNDPAAPAQPAPETKAETP